MNFYHSVYENATTVKRSDEHVHTRCRNKQLFHGQTVAETVEVEVQVEQIQKLRV